MERFEVTLVVDGHNENDVLSQVYKALYMADVDADSVRIRKDKKRGEVIPELLPEVKPKLVKRLMGNDFGLDAHVRPTLGGRYLN